MFPRCLDYAPGLQAHRPPEPEPADHPITDGGAKHLPLALTLSVLRRDEIQSGGVQRRVETTVAGVGRPDLEGFALTFQSPPYHLFVNAGSFIVLSAVIFAAIAIPAVVAGAAAHNLIPVLIHPLQRAPYPTRAWPPKGTSPPTSPTFQSPGSAPPGSNSNRWFGTILSCQPLGKASVNALESVTKWSCAWNIAK